MSKSFEPSHRIDLAFMVGNTVAAEFDAAVWEPVDANTPAQLELACTSRFEAMNAMPPGPYRLEGRLGATRIVAKDVWLKAFEREHHQDRRHSRPRLYLDQVYELEISSPTGASLAEGREVEYFLTACSLLNPAVLIERYPDGQVTRTVMHRVEFEHDTLGAVAFDTRHSIVETAPGVRSEVSSLCAKIARQVAFSVDIAEVDKAMQDALVVAGFAARYPVRIWGRQMTGEDLFSRTYFQALSSWTPDWVEKPHDALVSKVDVSRFLTQSCSTLSNLTRRQRDATQHALLAARSQYGTTEDQFRAVFSAFEGLCTVFDDPGAQRLTAAERARKRRITKALSEALEKLQAEDSSVDAKSILARLERSGAPADQRFRRFVAKFGVPVADLWPAYGTGPEALSLYAIRNRLAHGSLFAPCDLSGVHAALLHLQLLLERCVLGVLGWPVENSDASVGRNAGFTSSDEMRELMKELAAKYQ